MADIGVYEAKTQLPRLIARVAQGERITITRHGKPVAMLVPPEGSGKRPLAEVLAELAVFSKGQRLRGLSIRAMREAGRR
jgi:prevent-host-death family protein